MIPSDPASPRVAHDPVNDSGETPAATTGARRSGRAVAGRVEPGSRGFRFNLDDALARLSEPHQPIPRFNWSAVTPSTTDALSLQGPMHQRGARRTDGRRTVGCRAGPASTRSMFPDQDSRGRPLTQPTLDPLPEIREATQVGGPGATAHWSSVPAPCPAAGRRLVVAGPARRARCRPDDRDRHRRIRRRGERIQPRLRLRPDARRVISRRSATVCRDCPTPTRRPRPDGHDDVGARRLRRQVGATSAAKGRKKPKRAATASWSWS